MEKRERYHGVERNGKEGKMAWSGRYITRNVLKL